MIAVMRKLIYQVAFLVLMTVTSCLSRPDYVLDEDKMTQVLTDVHKAEGLIEVQRSETDADDHYPQQIMAAVFKHHGITRQQYDTSLVWYSQNLKYLIKVYKRVQANLDEEIDYWDQLADLDRDFAVSQAGDTVNLWSQASYAILDRARLTQLRCWTMASDSNFVQGDSIVWTFSVRHLSVGQYAFASLAVAAGEQDSVLFSSTEIARRDSQLCLSATLPFGQTPKHLFLSVAVMGDSVLGRPRPIYLDSISLIRIHRQVSQ